MKNRFYYSFSQDCISQKFGELDDNFNCIHGIRENFVLTPNGWERYSEWCSTENSKCNWEDARLVFETDDDPEIKIKYRKTSVLEEKDKEIEELKQQLADAEHEIENYQHELEVYKHNDNIYYSSIIKMNNKAKQNKIDFAVAEFEELKRILYESHYREINGKCYLEMEDFEAVVNCRIKELEEKK